MLNVFHVTAFRFQIMFFENGEAGVGCTYVEVQDWVELRNLEFLFVNSAAFVSFREVLVKSAEGNSPFDE